MPAKSDGVFKRIVKHCPQCREIIPASYAEKNPFPEFPCPSCGALVEISSLKKHTLTANHERAEGRFNASLKVPYNNYLADLALIVPGLDNPLNIKGEVIHIRIHNVSDEGAGIGIKFIDIDSESRKSLIEFTKTRNDFK